MGSSGRAVKAVFGSLVLVGFIWLLLVGVSHSKTRETNTSSWLGGRFKRLETIGSEKLDVQPRSDLNFMSKRRVPNGPDPIHNRRIGNSRQPPGHA
ncbi:hypothetical protein ACSBR1_006637 [Camellia fascicularis]